MAIRRERVTLVTDSSSGSTGYTTHLDSGGYLSAVYYTFTASFSTAASVAIVGDVTGIPYLTAVLTSTTNKLWQPRFDTHASTAGGSTIAGFAMLPIGNERLKVTVSSGGAAQTATFDVLIQTG